MHVFERLDKLPIYYLLFGGFLLLECFSQGGEEPTFVESVILLPIIEEGFFRLFLIGVVFLSLEFVNDQPKSKNKIEAYIISFLGLAFGLLVIFLPFKDYLEIITVISIVLAIFLLKILVNRPASEKLIVLVGLSSIGFGMSHGFQRFLPTFVAGLFFAILFLNKAKLEYWNETTTIQTKIKFLLIGCLVVYIIHLYNNLINRLFSNTLDICWITFLIFIGVVLLVYGTQIRSSKIEEKEF